MDEPIMDLDIKWIEEFESLDENYKTFYSEDVKCINFNYVYINKDDEVEQIKKEFLMLKEPNYISREELVGILKKNCKAHSKSYTVLSILKYNIDIDPEEITHLLKTSQDDNKFLKSLTNIDAIPLEKTISMFQDLNEIIVIFYEKPIYDKNNEHLISRNQTKRIYLKTIRGIKKRTYRKMA